MESTCGVESRVMESSQKSGWLNFGCGVVGVDFGGVVGVPNFAIGKRHAFKAIKSNLKTIHAKFETCRRSLEKNLELLRANTSFYMHVKHLFIDKLH